MEKYLIPMIIKTFKKLFIGGEWYVGLRDLANTPEKKYIQVKTPQDEWIADPFIVEEDGKHFLFCEQFVKKENKAGISCYEIVDGTATDGRFIIKEPYHLSYPCVFKIHGKYYMIPESSANNTIDLYEAVRFPYEWTHKKVLMSGSKYVDSTVYVNNGNYFLLSYKKNGSIWNLYVFSFDVDKLSLSFELSIDFNANTGRPAGFLYQEGNKLIRPSQFCKNKYGESLILNEVCRMDSSNFDERVYDRIEATDIEFPFAIDRIHTINRDSKYEVIDVFKERIDLIHGLKIFKRVYLKK